MCLYFGAPLTGQPRTPLKGYGDRIPTILVLLAKELRARGGFETEGIFRVSALSGAVELARDVLNMGQGMNSLNKEDGPNVCAALIKDWFRSLPQGESNLGALKISDLGNLAKNFSDAEANALLFTDKYLKEPNRSVFLWSLDLMCYVVQKSKENRMSEKAIAIVFAPNMWEAPSALGPLEAMNAVKDVAQLIQNCLVWLIKNDTLAERNTFNE